MQRTVVRGGRRALLQLRFRMYSVRKNIFLSGESQGISKTVDCGKHARADTLTY